MQAFVEKANRWIGGKYYLEVAHLKEKLTEEQIIERIAGGDKTIGSCASLALAYAANKGGLDVLDFKDGYSRMFFANHKHIAEIVEIVGGMTYNTNRGEWSTILMSGMDLMQQAEQGKEYCLAIGRHAAIVRINDDGVPQYLELQSAVKEENTWCELSDDEFKKRFLSFRKEIYYSMVEISKLYTNKEYKNLMGYINTKKEDQKKGFEGGKKITLLSTSKKVCQIRVFFVKYFFLFLCQIVRVVSDHVEYLFFIK